MTTDDTFFGEPFHDIDEWREAPVPNRDVHGGLAGTDTRFSFLLPSAQLREGRFPQPEIGGMGGNENVALTPMADLFGSIRSRPRSAPTWSSPTRATSG